MLPCLLCALSGAGNQIHTGGHPLLYWVRQSDTGKSDSRDLKPLLDTLRSKGIHYKWKYPFCLSASMMGRTALLKVPEDLPHFCGAMGIPLVDVPNWYAEFRRTVARKNAPQEEPMEAQGTRYRRRRSPSALRHPIGPRPGYPDVSPTDSPRSRRACRDC